MKESSIELAAKSVIDKIKKDGKKVSVSFSDLIRSEAFSIPSELYEHLPEGVVIENATNPHSKGRVLEDNELREGELSASIYQVGCYSVRVADRVYRKGDFEPSSDNEIKLEGKGVKQGEAMTAQSADIPPFKSRYSRPATKEELEEYRNAIKNPVEAITDPPRDYQKVKEVSAAYMDGEYKNICQAMYAQYGSYTDRLTFMGIVKLNKSVLDSQASLFVGSEYVGDSHSTEDFYAFSPDGYIRRYWIGGLDPDSFSAKWDWNG